MSRLNRNFHSLKSREMDDNAAGKEPFLSEDFTSGSSEYSLVLDYPRNFLSRTQWMDSYPSTLRIQRTKWSRLLTRHKWSIFSHNEKKILARKGVPPEFRPKIWIEALKLSAFVNSQRRTYQDYLEESKNTLNQNPVAKNIEKDVDRTFPVRK